MKHQRPRPDSVVPGATLHRAAQNGRHRSPSQLSRLPDASGFFRSIQRTAEVVVRWLSAASPLTATGHACKRRPIVVTAITVLAIAATALVSPSASASSTNPGDFTSLLNGNPSIIDQYGCKDETGIVVDPAPPYNGWRHIGGVRISCAYYHVLSSDVQLDYWNGNQWVGWRSYHFDNPNGFDIGMVGDCAGDATRRWWAVQSWVTFDGGVQWTNWSPAFQDPPGGRVWC